MNRSNGALNRAIYLTAMLVPVLPDVAFAQTTAASAADKVWDIGNRRQLLIDHRFIAESFNTDLCVHQATKTREMTIKPDKTWEVGGVGPYSSVLKDGDTYLMWYHVRSSVQWAVDNDAGAICFARSKDGITWEKPNLGVVEFNGSKENNIVLGQGAGGIKMGQDGGMVFIDPNAPADEKFRMFIPHGSGGGGLHVFSSPDGIQWKLTHKDVVTARPQEKGHHLDSQNVLFWDDAIKKYVFYGRKNQNTPASQGRSIARGESSDLKSFPVVQDMPVVMGPDRFDDFYKQGPMVDYYMPAASKYPWADSIYVMFPTAYYHYIGGGILPEFKGDIPVNAGPLDTHFAASRDGVVWQRYDRRPFVPLGMKGEFDWANTRTVYGIVPSVDGRYIYMYYRGGDWLHGWDRNASNKKLLTEAGLGADKDIAVLSRIELRMDGFVSVHGAYTGGAFTTTPLRFSGNKLVLNVDTSATGIGYVEIVDADGFVVDGFAQTDCDMIHTCNDINRVVSWKGKSDLSKLAGKPIRLRFFLRNADLYAFQFAD